MPDYYGIVPRAVAGLSQRHRPPLEIETVEMEFTATQEDSAGQPFLTSWRGCIITMGGDGTNRMVAKGCEVPLLPISTGTNNVFPKW